MNARSGSAVLKGIAVTGVALVMLAGARSLFALLATVMVLTRRLDWYRSGNGFESTYSADKEFPQPGAFSQKEAAWFTESRRDGE